MKSIFLSSKNYRNPDKNNGDCILVDTGKELVVYDCGCEEHAQRVLDYMKNHSYESAKLVLSHNDADHFDGIPYLIKENALSEVYTLLLLKYKDDLLDRIQDNRRNRDSIARSIEEIYSNIYSLSGKVMLKDIFTDTDVSSGITIPGPGKEYALDAVAKGLDSRKSDDIDKETIVNAVSTQLSVNYGTQKKLLLTGDSSYAALEDVLKSHSCIQLPHHGKLAQAEDIFQVKDNGTVYYVSDNTGESNGGSDSLREKYPRGRVIYYTKDGDLVCDEKSFKATAKVASYFMED